MKDIKAIHIARVTIETTLPLSIGSGHADLFLDMPIALDANGLPFIPGTSIAGVLRSAMRNVYGHEKNSINHLFGFQEGNKGKASNFIFSSAHLLGSTGIVAEGILEKKGNRFAAPYLQQISVRGIEKRDRVRINHRGTAVKSAKFDISMLIPGARFVFDIKYLSEGNDDGMWKQVLDALHSKLVRFGRSTRSGFGDFAVVQVNVARFNLAKEAELNQYMEWTGGLNDPLPNSENYIQPTKNNKGYTAYTVELEPDDFFLFSNGKKDSASGEADMSALRGARIVWNGKTPDFQEEEIVIPASSVKGALAHRTLFHYNRLKGKFADQKAFPEDEEEWKENIRELFGFAKDDKNAKANEKAGMAGKLRFSDVYLNVNPVDSFTNIAHVSIDRLTQGNIQGALFQEEVVDFQKEKKNLKLEILLEESETLDNSEKILLEAFEYALDDLCNKRLPVGGGVNRGHGRFTGKCIKS